jgi:hypothetical protein
MYTLIFQTSFLALSSIYIEYIMKIMGSSSLDTPVASYKAKDRVWRTPLKLEVNSGAPEGLAVPAPLVTPVVLI